VLSRAGTLRSEIELDFQLWVNKLNFPTIMSLADYLAKNYLTADSAPEKKIKKRKRKDVAPTAGLLIADDATEDWKTQNNAADEDAPILGSSHTRYIRLRPALTIFAVSGRSSEF